MTTWLLPDLLWQRGRFVPDIGVALDTDQGRILEVGTPPAGAPLVRLPRAALLPAFVNAHSHAFQRALRGRAEFRPQGVDDDFWSWRELMYALAGRLDPDEVGHIARALFEEMRAAGFAAVGEFHYLHHDKDGAPYPDPIRMSRVVIDAALDAGLRVCLLAVLYHSGAIDQPASPRQRRFVSPDLPSWFSHVDRLLDAYGDHPRVSVGLAPHSIRAVPRAWLAEIADFNRGRRLPVHMHLCEQPAEVEQSRRHFGAGPIAVVQRAGLLDEHLVAVHATHLDDDDPARLADAGSRVCACPSTEANLGDGVLPAERLMAAGVPVCIGTDSHILVNPFEEMRLIENNVRLQQQKRNVLAGLMQPTPPVDGALRIAPGLLTAATAHGADALGLRAGYIEPGRLADLVAVNLDDFALRDVPTDALPEALVFSADTRCVLDTWVHGTSARHG